MVFNRRDSQRPTDISSVTCLVENQTFTNPLPGKYSSVNPGVFVAFYPRFR